MCYVCFFVISLIFSLSISSQSAPLSMETDLVKCLMFAAVREINESHLVGKLNSPAISGVSRIVIPAALTASGNL